ncbi:NAD(P)/FAD-dependent oxidoreductase [Streptomyces sp. NPDC101062]|uniref:NAD(P)/FAD-dependent oxidoreductase n=1 Tax=unclassified Streptomyces TaxID=2593676 RepID=UPI002E76F423|nr:NAD(P)/FAD-dependent oxidoreductase [Streptomyces sp. JV176]MEE1803373.1 NAD(P)/FAD-dependent oxidoreductase [Streptomyces sp. JV176]
MSSGNGTSGTRRRTAIVVGAGIGGLAAAVTLRSVGIDVEVHERAGELRPAGTGLSVMTNSMTALASLGIDLRLAERGRVIETAELMTRTGGRIKTLPYRELTERLGAPSVCVSRSELQAALLEAAGDCPIRLGSAATGYTVEEDGVRVRFADGREAHADLLIGADGIHSAIRRQLAGPEELREAGYLCWLAVTPFDHPRLTPGFNGHYWGRGQRFGLHDIGQGQVYWWGTRNMSAEAARGWKGDKEDIARAFDGWADVVGEVIRATPEESVHAVPAQDRPFLERWGEGPVTLLGDAAHPMLTALAQGGSTAIEDAVVLARSCAAASDPAAGLRAYEAARRDRTRWLVDNSYSLSRNEQEERPLATAVRDTLMRYAPTSLLMRPFEKAMTYEPPRFGADDGSARAGADR